MKYSRILLFAMLIGILTLSVIYVHHAESDLSVDPDPWWRQPTAHLALDTIGNQTVAKGANLNFTVTTTHDPCIVAPTLTVSNLPQGTNFIDNGDGTGVFDWTPDYIQAGTYSGVHFEATDGTEIVSEDITISVVEYIWEPLYLNGGGFVNVITIDPNNPEHLYVGSDVAGIFKSEDFGGHWQHSGQGLKYIDDYYISAIAVDPFDSRTIYALIGGGGSNKGMFKSTNGGQNWELISSDIGGGARHVQNCSGNLIAINLWNTNEIYAASYLDGLYKTTDGGDGWTKLDITSDIGREVKYITSVALDPSNPQIIYAAERKSESEGRLGGIYKSEAGGKAGTWRSLNIYPMQNVRWLAIDPEDPKILYAAAEEEGIYKSTDGGETWFPINDGLEFMQNESGIEQIAYSSIAIDPEDTFVLYAGSRAANPYTKQNKCPRAGVYKSINGGATWEWAATNIHTDNVWLNPQNRMGGKSYKASQVVIDPQNTQRVYVAGRSGVWRTENGGEDWYFISDQMEVSGATRVLVDPNDPDRIYVSMHDWTFFYSEDGGETFIRSNNGMSQEHKPSMSEELILDPRTNPSTIYAAIRCTNATQDFGSVYKSIDGGKTWQEANGNLPNAAVKELAIDPTNYDILYAALPTQGIYKSEDGGERWFPINEGLPLPEELFATIGWMGDLNISICINSQDSNIIYLTSEQKGVYKSVDGGQWWQEVTAGLPERNKWFKARALAIDPNNPEVLYLGLAHNGIYKTADGASTWQEINSDIYATYIDVDPDTSFVYAGTRIKKWSTLLSFEPGIYRSKDGGENWDAIHNGAVSLHNKSISFDPHDNNGLYLAVVGSIFRGIHVNSPPVLSGIGNQSVNEGDRLNFQVASSDYDLDALTLSIDETLPQGAVFTDNGDGTGDFSWTPGFTQEGDYNLTFRVNDGMLGDDELITISVQDVDITEPVINITSPINRFTFSDPQLTITVTGSASDNVGVTSVTVNGIAATTGNNYATWSADITLLGSNSITAIAEDAAGNLDSASLNCRYKCNSKRRRNSSNSCKIYCK